MTADRGRWSRNKGSRAVLEAMDRWHGQKPTASPGLRKRAVARHDFILGLMRVRKKSFLVALKTSEENVRRDVSEQPRVARRVQGGEKGGSRRPWLCLQLTDLHRQIRSRLPQRGYNDRVRALSDHPWTGRRYTPRPWEAYDRSIDRSIGGSSTYLSVRGENTAFQEWKMIRGFVQDSCRGKRKNDNPPPPIVDHDQAFINVRGNITFEISPIFDVSFGLKG